MIEEGMEPAYESVTPGSAGKRPPPLGAFTRDTANEIGEMPGRAAMVGGRPTLAYLRPARGASPLQEATMADTLYKRLGGYDAIAAVADNLLPRLMGDSQLGRFWKHRGDDGVRREKQLLIDYLCAAAGGPLYYVGRDMKTSHRGMGITERDWQIFLGHLTATLDHFKVPPTEKSEVLGFVESLKKDVVE
jgi:hemoglobin